MRLYHGTSFSASRSIINSRKILHKIKRTYDASSTLPTTDGFVYLKSNIGYAIYMANKEAYFQSDKYLSVFEVELSEKELLPDFDELEYVHNIKRQDSSHYNYVDSINKSQCCCVARSLNLFDDVRKQLVLPSSMTRTDPLNSLTDKLIMLRNADDHQNAMELLKEQVWKLFDNHAEKSRQGY